MPKNNFSARGWGRGQTHPSHSPTQAHNFSLPLPPLIAPQLPASAGTELLLLCFLVTNEVWLLVLGSEMELLSSVQSLPASGNDRTGSWSPLLRTGQKSLSSSCVWPYMHTSKHIWALWFGDNLLVSRPVVVCLGLKTRKTMCSLGTDPLGDYF